VTADYGRPIPAMIHRGTVFGCQFHPEKSGAVGLGILEKFKESVNHGWDRSPIISRHIQVLLRNIRIVAMNEID